MIKRFIRHLYWQYAHKGDPWQMRLAVYHIKQAIKLESKDTPRSIIIAQLNKQFERVSEVHFNKPLCVVKDFRGRTCVCEEEI